MKKLLTFCIVCAVALAGTAHAATTIGTNILTTGTMTVTPAEDSATSVQFQNAAGTSIFVVDTSNTRVGVNGGNDLDTTFEVGGTASISGIITLGGSGTSGGQFRPGANSATAFRFQNAAGSTNVLTIDTSSTRVGVNAGGAVDTTFEVGGTASISGLALFGGNASVSGNFEVGGNASNAFRVIGSSGDTNLEDLVASGSAVFGYTAASGSGFALQAVQADNTATLSIDFDSGSAKGTCLMLRDTVGALVYCRIVGGGTAFTCSTTSCK